MEKNQKEKIKRASAKLHSLKNNIPQGYEVESRWVQQFNDELEGLEKSNGMDLEEFKVSPSDLKKSVAFTSPSSGVEYRQGLWCERSILLHKLDSFLTYLSSETPMNHDPFFYPDVFLIAGGEYQGQRDMPKEQVLIPYEEAPNVGIGDTIIQKSGGREIELKVIDTSFRNGGSLNVGTNQPHMLTLKVENITANTHRTNNQNSVYHIGSIAGEQVQVGNNNSQISNITLQNLVEKVAASKDPEAKNLLRKALENGTIAKILGTGTALITLIKLLAS